MIYLYSFLAYYPIITHKLFLKFIPQIVDNFMSDKNQSLDRKL